MHRSDWRFLHFNWKEEYYQFKTLPFGLTSAPYVFTKLLRPVAALFRQEGLRILVYLDDWLLMASCPDLLKDQSEYVSSTLHAVTGISTEWQEMHHGAEPVYRVSGLDNRLQEDDPVLACSQGRQGTQGVPTNFEPFGGNGSPIIPHNWPHDISPTYHPPNSVTLQSPSAPKDGSSGTEGVPRLQHLCEAFIRSSRRSTVVDPLAPSSQWKANLFGRTDTGS